jgi:hypothetical protein
VAHSLIVVPSISKKKNPKTLQPLGYTRPHKTMSSKEEKDVTSLDEKLLEQCKQAVASVTDKCVAQRVAGQERYVNSYKNRLAPTNVGTKTIIVTAMESNHGSFQNLRPSSCRSGLANKWDASDVVLSSDDVIAFLDGDSLS